MSKETSLVVPAFVGGACIGLAVFMLILSLTNRNPTGVCQDDCMARGTMMANT